MNQFTVCMEIFRSQIFHCESILEYHLSVEAKVIVNVVVSLTDIVVAIVQINRKKSPKCITYFLVLYFKIIGLINHKTFIPFYIFNLRIKHLIKNKHTINRINKLLLEI